MTQCVCVFWCRCSHKKVSGGRDLGRRRGSQPQLYVNRGPGNPCTGE